MQKKMEKGEVTMEDFLAQMKTLRRMGPLKQLLGLLPGVGAALKDVNIDEKHMDKIEAMIHSMTPEERRQPQVINASRRRRVAAGSGTQQNDVGNLVRQFETVTRVTKQMANMSAGAKVKAVRQMGAAGMGEAAGMGMPGLSMRGSTHTPSIKDRFKKRKR